MFLIILLYTLLGFSFTLGKITLFYASPFYIVGTRMMLGGFGLWLYYYLVKSTSYTFQKKDWPIFMQVTLFGIVVPYCLRAWGLHYLSSTKAAFIFTLMPFFTALFAFLLHKERLSFQKSIGLMIGFLGMMPTLFTGSSLENLAGTFGLFSWPELAMLGAVASFGYNLIALQRLIKVQKCPPELANGLTMLLGGFLSLNLAFIVEPVWIFKSAWKFAGFLLLQIIISNLICSNLQAMLLKRYSSTFMAFAGFLTPLCASFFGWFFLHEEIHIQYLVSLMMVMVGLGMFYFDEITGHQKDQALNGS
jgi:drug/metabolite transporter (DMT)-like permease